MGADTGTYVLNFLYMIDTPLELAIKFSRMEVGYLTFVKLLTYITHSGLIYQVICISFMIFCMYIFLRQFEIEDALLYIYFYCTLGIFFFMFTGTRQCLAMSICLFSYQFLVRKKYFKFLMCILLAFFFHRSSVLFLSILFIYNRKISKVNVLVYSILTIIAGKYLNIIQQWFNDKLEYNYGIESTGNGLIFFIIILLFTIFSIVMTYNCNKSLNANKYSRILMNINFITLSLWFLRLYTRIAERPSYYFMFFSCIFYANALNNIMDVKKRKIYKIIIFILTMLLYVYRLNTNFKELIPYEIYN